MLGFGCSHKRTSFPQTPSRGSKRAARGIYVVCLSCGKEFDYDWKAMKIGEPVRPGAPAQLQEQRA